MLPIREYAEDEFVFMATSNGTVKKVALTNFARQRSVGYVRLNWMKVTPWLKPLLPMVRKMSCYIVVPVEQLGLMRPLFEQWAGLHEGLEALDWMKLVHMVDMIIPEENGPNTCG